MSGKSLKGLVPLCHDCHNIIEFSRTGWKRTLDGANNKLAELTSSHTPKRKYELILKAQQKRKEKRPNVCNTRAKVLEAEEKLAQNKFKMAATRQAGSSPLARFM